MSYTRFGWLRRWTAGESGAYSYLERQEDGTDKVRILSYGDVLLDPEDFFEIVMSVIEQAGVLDRLSRDDILKIADRCGVTPSNVVFMDRDSYIELAWRDMKAKSKEVMEQLGLFQKEKKHTLTDMLPYLKNAPEYSAQDIIEFLKKRGK